MKTFIGIDLGSTTTKAVLMNENQEILGRGITNSRSNYDTAAAVCKQEAKVGARFTMFHNALGANDEGVAHLLEDLERNFRLEQFLHELKVLEETCYGYLDHPRFKDMKNELHGALREVFSRLEGESAGIYAPGAARKSDFFRDIAGSRFMNIGEEVSKAANLPFEHMLNVYDKSIIDIESLVTPDAKVAEQLLNGLGRAVRETDADVSEEDARTALKKVLDIELEETYVVGTGYGRVRLPFPKEHIRSEILCHGLGAHKMFPGTRTVLDIGGQDTKGIQIDEKGIVDNFQMNDRCAAGCGRYLGYIADEMNIGLHELGPIAEKAKKATKINSTCTVFAGAELRDRLALGEDRADILAGLHRAIILRAMSIISRAGGVTDQFTFTGGVAKNNSAVKELRKLIKENYGDVTINISDESIYTGALGGATFAYRAVMN